jgi:hypothetical protein
MTWEVLALPANRAIIWPAMIVRMLNLRLSCPGAMFLRPS